MGRPACLSKKAKDRTGDRCGLLVAIEPTEYTHGEWRWLYQCDCGNTKSMYPHAAKSAGDCGCREREKKGQPSKTHGMTRTKTYSIWASMRTRCEDPSSPRNKNYAGRGIRVCARWRLFQNFLDDMGEKPDGMSLDRIDNDGDYCPENCRWATKVQQCNNKRTNNLIEIDGQIKTISQWSGHSGVSVPSIIYRMNHGMTAKDAVFMPPYSVRKHLSSIKTLNTR